MNIKLLKSLDEVGGTKKGNVYIIPLVGRGCDRFIKEELRIHSSDNSLPLSGIFEVNDHFCNNFLFEEGDGIDELFFFETIFADKVYVMSGDSSGGLFCRKVKVEGIEERSVWVVVHVRVRTVDILVPRIEQKTYEVKNGEFSY